MKYNRIISAMTALLCLAGASSCGKTDKSDTDSKPKGIDSSDVIIPENNSDTTINNTDKESDTSAVQTTTVTDKSENIVTTTVKGHSAGENKLTTKTSGNSQTPARPSSGGSSVPSGGTQQTGGSQNSGGGSSSPSSGGTGGSGSSQKPSGGSQQLPTQNSTEAPPENDVYTAEITLSSAPEFTGSNVSVDDSVVTITAGGDYRFTGALADGQICVNTATEEKVMIVLDGVDIHNSSGPAIFINEAKKCTVKVREGSVNNLSDNGKNKQLDGVIYSNDTLRIKGNGTLNIDAGNAHGICSDDDIIIENGDIYIKSKKSGLIANDDITINGGTLEVMGGTNGLKSKGTIHINGGNSVISGGTKEEKCSIYVAGEFAYTGGWLFAAGNQVYSPTSSTNPYVIATFSNAVPGGTSAEMVLDGTQMCSFNPHCSFRSLLMLAPEITDGSSFYTVIDGNSSDNFTVSGNDNIFGIN